MEGQWNVRGANLSQLQDKSVCRGRVKGCLAQIQHKTKIPLFQFPVNYSKQRNATLAQLVERLIRNQQVAGSIPAGGSTKFTLGYRTQPGTT